MREIRRVGAQKRQNNRDEGQKEKGSATVVHFAPIVSYLLRRTTLQDRRIRRQSGDDDHRAESSATRDSGCGCKVCEKRRTRVRNSGGDHHARDKAVTTSWLFDDALKPGDTRKAARGSVFSIWGPYVCLLCVGMV